MTKTPEALEVEEIEETSRGNKKFGSTGCDAISEGDLEQLVWSEHFVVHWSPWKVFQALGRKGTPIPMRIVERICGECEIGTKFHQEFP